MCGPKGDSGGSKIKPPDPMQEAKAQIEMMRTQYKLDQKAAIRAAEREAEQEAIDRAQWSTDLQKARSNTRQGIKKAFKAEGLRPRDYKDQIGAALNIEAGGKSFGGDTSFSSDIGANLLDDIRNSTIRDYSSAVDKFAPVGFENRAIGDKKDDQILKAILEEQFGDATTSIDTARARGNLNDTGFAAAMDDLNTQKKAAMSRLQSLGGGVLEGYRDELTDIADSARTGASSWDFGETFNPKRYNRMLNTKRDKLLKGLEGDVRSTIGGEQFFNLQDLISRAGISQGAQNTGLGGQSLLGALAARKQEEEQQRGLGTTGSF